jgi:aspartyl/asparaginyl beta-hydroxylase (cupin superfamily)
MPFAFTPGSRRAHTPEPILTAPVDYLRHSAEGSVRFFSSEVHVRKGAIMHEPQEGDDMDSMDNIRERFEALEQRTERLQQHARMVEQRLRWWLSPGEWRRR